MHGQGGHGGRIVGGIDLVGVRLHEPRGRCLDAPRQGASDPFGMPTRRRGRRVVEVRGNHSLNADRDALRAAVRDWLGYLKTKLL